MEARREMENKKLDETALIARGFALYKKYAKIGQEVPAGEAEVFQKLTKKSLTDLVPVDEVDYQENGARRKRWTVKTEEGEFIEDDRRFKDFRQTVGTAALLGKFKLAGKDVGLDFMRLFFGDRDAETFKNVFLLAREFSYHLNRYSLTDMKSVYLFAANKFELGEIFSGEAWKALSRLGSFLTIIGTDEDKEKIFIEQIVLNQVGLQKELEQRFSEGFTPDQIAKEMATNQEELGRLWTGFKVASLEQAPDLVIRILNLSTENATLKQFEKFGAPGMFFPTMPPALFANRARAGAYGQMASEKYRQVNALATDSLIAQALTKRAKQYEETATKLWQAGQQAPSDQEVAHD